MATRTSPPYSRQPQDEPLRPEVLPPVDPHMEKLGWLLDNAFSIGPFRFGLDGLVGLVPGVGDMAGTLIGGFIIMRAIQQGVPKAAVARMVANTGLDAVLGVVPFVGDLFDFAFKSNSKNLRIYHSALAGQRREANDWGFVVLVGVALLAILALPVLALVWLVQQLPSLL